MPGLFRRYAAQFSKQDILWFFLGAAVVFEIAVSLGIIPSEYEPFRLVAKYHEEVTACGALVLALIVGIQVWDARKSSEKQLRAYISVEPLGINQYGPGDNFLGHVAIRNRGRVPARNVSYVIDIDWKPDGHWAVGKPGNIVPRDIVLQPRTKIKLGSPFKPNTLVQSAANPSYLYVFGRVEYQDGFRKERRFTNFCHRYNCEVIKFGREHLLPPGNGRYHEKHNDAD